jgi:hypothetical protein
MRTEVKITPAAYPDLLEAIDTGVSQRELARRYDCAHSLIARHVARAKRARELNDAEDHRGEPIESGSVSIREILEARIRDPKTSARDLASLVNALARLETLENPTPALNPQSQHREGKYGLHELRNAARLELPVFMPGVSEWLDALTPDVEGWSHLPDAPVELVDQYGNAHHVLAEEESFFRDQAGWKTPPVWEPEEARIEEMRAIIADYDAHRAAQVGVVS